MPRGFIVIVLGLMITVAFNDCRAAVITQSHLTSGGYFSNGNSSDTNTIYTARLNIPSQGDRRSYFVFDLSSIMVPAGEIVTGATLRLDTQPSPAGNSTYTLFDYPNNPNTNNLTIDQLKSQNGDLQGLNIYNALGTGTAYGSRSFVSDITAATTLEFNLNMAAISDINAAIGGEFAIGGSFTSVDSGGAELFSMTGGTSIATRELVLRTTAIPEPSSIAFLAFGASGFIARRLRRSRSARRQPAFRNI